MYFREITSKEIDDYNLRLEKSVNSDIFQSVNWSIMKKGTWEPHYFIVQNDNNDTLAYATVLIRKIPLLNNPMLYLPRGPILNDYTDKKLWNYVIDNLVKFAQSIGAIFIKIDPAILENQQGEQLLEELGFISLKSNKGFGGFEPAATIHLNLEGSTEEVFNRIPKKTRYNVTYPTKKGVTFKNVGIEALDDYMTVMYETSSRSKFFIRKDHYYKKLFEVFTDKITFTIAYFEEEPLAAGITIVYGKKAWAFSAGSVDKHRKLNAFSGLAWERMLWAKSKGANIFDLYGIPVEREIATKNNEKVFGIYKFKKSFGGEEIDFVGEYDLPVNKLQYKLWRAMLSAQTIFVKLKGVLRKI